jgi:hypothetical protein
MVGASAAPRLMGGSSDARWRGRGEVQTRGAALDRFENASLPDPQGERKRGESAPTITD